MDFLDINENSALADKWVNLTGSDWAGLAGVVIGGVSGTIKSKNELKATQAQAQALNTQSAANIEIARLNALTAQTMANTGYSAGNPAPKKGLSTGAIAGIVIGGLALVGVIAYVALKK